MSKLSRTNQRYIVYAYMLNNGFISQKQATELGISRLPAVILQLKKQGVKIKWRVITGMDRYGNKTWWKEYGLDDVH